MKNTKKRLLSMLLAVVMTLSLVPFTAFAVDVDNVGEDVESDVTLPDGITSASFPENTTVTDGTNYYATLMAALEGIHLNADKRTLWCKPNADVGTMTHGHVCASLTVYGNGAYVSGGERDFEVDTYKFCHNGSNACEGLTSELTLKVIALNGSGAWGERKSAYSVNLVFENCKEMDRVYFTGTTGVNNITLTDCSFKEHDENRDCAVYSNANGKISLKNVDFSDIKLPVNLNHKVAGVQKITVEKCKFVNCGKSTANYSAPIRVLSSVEGGSSQLTVKSCTFSGTVTNSIGQDADILLDYGVGTTTADISNTAAKVGVEKETDNEVGYTTVTADKTTAVSNVSAAVSIGETEYATLAAAFAAAKNGDTVKLLQDVTLTETVAIDDTTVTSDFTLDGNNKTVILDFFEKANGIQFTGAGVKDGIKINDLRVLSLNNNAKTGIQLWAGKTSLLTNVIVEGEYSFAGVNFGGTHGGTAKNCEFVSAFANAQTANPVKLVNTKIGYMQVNCPSNGVVIDGIKLFADANSKITKLHVHEENTLKIDRDIFMHGNIVGELTLGDERDDPAEAVVNNVYYTKLEDALLNAEQGSTVKMLMNISVDGYVIVDNRVTLDLNGKTLTSAKSVIVAKGWIIDGAGDMSGRIVIKNGGLRYSNGSTGEYIPVYEQEGGYDAYRFVKLDIQISNVDADDNSLSFEFSPSLGTDALDKQYFSNGAEDVGMTFSIIISWKDSKGINHVEQIIVDDSIIAEAYSSENIMNLSFSVSGISSSITEYDVSVVVTSDTGVMVDKVACSYDSADVAA